MERRQNDLNEYHADPRAFQERLEQLNAAQMEPVHPPSLRESLLASNKKGRLYSDKRKHPAGGVMPEKEKVASGPSSPTLPSNPVIFFLDTTDSELMVSFSLRLQFSSKVDIKNGAPPKDPLATLRAGWVPPIDHVMVDQSTGYTQRGGGIKGKQRETQVSAEELLKADQGRLSRQRFLENPRNILLPYLAASDDGSLPSKESARTGLSKDQGVMPVNPSRVVLDVSEEANYLHAPILNESEYSIQVIPLRAVEIMPSCDHTPPTSASGFMQQRARSPGEKVSPRLAAFPQPTFMPNAAADEDADVNELRVPIQEVYRGLTEKLKKQQDERIQWRECTKEVLREFWGAQKPGASLVSLLGSKEELPVKRRKSRQKQ
ncbi:calpain-like cysteine peptidase [Trypanosoma cruzi]|nr:calpain-like cysteine peptidase [Trypanosoma cruzi]